MQNAPPALTWASPEGLVLRPREDFEVRRGVVAVYAVLVVRVVEQDTSGLLPPELPPRQPVLATKGDRAVIISHVSPKPHAERPLVAAVSARGDLLFVGVEETPATFSPHSAFVKCVVAQVFRKSPALSVVCVRESTGDFPRKPHFHFRAAPPPESVFLAHAVLRRLSYFGLRAWVRSLADTDCEQTAAPPDLFQ